MTTEVRPPTSERLISLDAFRGLTIAGMIMVNNPGSWKSLYSPLGHAHWHGWTPTDLVFPFFLFIVGVAMAFSFGRRRTEPGGNAVLIAQVFRRAIVLVALGLLMAAFPDLRLVRPYIAIVIGLGLLHVEAQRLLTPRNLVALVIVAVGVFFFAWDFAYFNEKALRVPGVLQRIGVCYLFTAIIMMLGGVRLQIAAGIGLLLGYWAICTYVAPPAGFEAKVVAPDGLLHDWVDQQVLGNHMYSERPDPEGLLSTLPAIATVLAGALAGHWLRSPRERSQKLIGLFVAGNILLLAGLWWGLSFPINKKIWTSSYVLTTAGVALQVLGMCYWLIDLRGFRAWATPLIVFGSNAIVVYVASSMTAKWLAITEMSPGGPKYKAWLFETIFAPNFTPLNASLAYALTYVSVWLIPMGVLYRLRFFVKI